VAELLRSRLNGANVEIFDERTGQVYARIATSGVTLDGAAIGTTSAFTTTGVITGGSLRSPEVTFANAPASPTVGQLVNFSDSNTITWGATIAGSSTNHVLGRWNGTVWTVVGT
jgi:hypothetical protein